MDRLVYSLDNNYNFFNSFKYIFVIDSNEEKYIFCKSDQEV